MVSGRIVWVVGNLFSGAQKTDLNTKQPKIGVDGKPIMEYGFGLAVSKAVLGQMGPGEPGEIWAAMHQEAYTLFPSRQIPPSFAMKYKDGDTAIDEKGVPYSQREGYAGHIVLACKTQIPIKYYRYENGQNILTNEGIKCGDYIEVQLSVKAHAATGQAKSGLYLNPLAVRFLGYGKEIVNRPSGDQIFGATAPVIPQGASATPIATGNFIVPTESPVQQQQFAPPPIQQQAPAPHYGVVPQQFQPQAPVQQQQFAPPPMQQQFAPPPMQQQAPAPTGIPGLPKV